MRPALADSLLTLLKCLAPHRLGRIRSPPAPASPHPKRAVWCHRPTALRVGLRAEVALCAPAPPTPPPRLAAARGGMPPPPHLRPYHALLPLEEPEVRMLPSLARRSLLVPSPPMRPRQLECHRPQCGRGNLNAIAPNAAAAIECHRPQCGLGNLTARPPCGLSN